jgi:uncharacterized protein YjbI with pentapeptide repeats
MPIHSPYTANEPSPHVEKLLDSANSASQTIAALHVAFMAFVAYFGVIVWGTSHDDLLRISPVKLPILDVELPLTTFYCFVPWMLVLLHFNLLMQLELLSCKLWNLDRDLPDSAIGQQVRDRLFIFPFTHLIVGRSNVWLIRWLLSLVVGITVIVLPLSMLLAAQIRFLPFHDEGITWSQRFAVWIDAGMLITLWPLIASPQDKAKEWWQNALYLLVGYWPAQIANWCTRCLNWLTKLIHSYWQQFPRLDIAIRPLLHSRTAPKGMVLLLSSVPLILLLSIVALVPGSINLQNYQAIKANPQAISAGNSPFYLEDWLIRRLPEAWLSVAAHQYDAVSCSSITQAAKSDAAILQVMLGPCAWFNMALFTKNLNLQEARLVPKEVSLSLLTRAIDPDKQIRDLAFKEFDGLNLQNRDLRFANMLGAVLPKADLRHVQLQGSVLLKAKLQGVIGWDKTQLQGAILGGTQLQSSGLVEADLQGADLRGANLQGANLSWTKLQGADMRGARLQGADLHNANLQGSDLRGAELQAANLREANFQGADMDFVKLQGADLVRAQFQSVKLRQAGLQGADWAQANFDGLFITESNRLILDGNQRAQLEILLNPILDSQNFAVFRQRLSLNEMNSEQLAPPISQMGCYSDNPSVLNCNYQNQMQLAAYRAEVLFPTLVRLACSDVATAMGIVRRAINKSTELDPDFGLAAALLNAANLNKPCLGLTILSEQTRAKLLQATESVR